MSKKKHVAPKPDDLRLLAAPVGAVSITAPLSNQPADVVMGLLVTASGDATAENAALDTLRDGQVILYNNFNVGETITESDIASRGFPVDATGPVNGVYTWSSGDASAIGQDAPAPVNNRLYVLARWDRGMDPIGQVSADVSYKGTNARAALRPKTAETKYADKPTRKDLRPRPIGRWLDYRKIEAKTPLKGHRLLDAAGNFLRASRIEVYAYDVDWKYTDLSHPSPAKAYRVRRPIGGTICIDAGPSFLSPHNSLIIWQGNWRTRERTVIVADSASKAGVVELDPTLDIYIHVNYHRVKPLVVDGTFGLKVRVLE